MSSSSWSSSLFLSVCLLLKFRTTQARALFVVDGGTFWISLNIQQRLHSLKASQISSSQWNHDPCWLMARSFRSAATMSDHNYRWYEYLQYILSCSSSVETRISIATHPTQRSALMSLCCQILACKPLKDFTGELHIKKTWAWKRRYFSSAMLRNNLCSLHR